MMVPKEHIRTEEGSDHWYTPECIIKALVDAHGSVIDIMTSPETPDVKGLYRWFGDVHDIDEWVNEVGKYNALFVNPTYSKISGGAQYFINLIDSVMSAKHPAMTVYYLVNYDAWVSKVAVKLDLDIGLISPRIKFIRGPKNIKKKKGSTDSPRHANALLTNKRGFFELHKEHKSFDTPIRFGPYLMWTR